MSISIPAILDTQLNLIKAGLVPVADGVTHTESYVIPAHALGNRVADILRLLVSLINSGTLTATGGTATSVQDSGAFTGVNSLVGATVDFDGNITPGLAGVSAVVISNTVDALTFAPGAIPAAPGVGDTYRVRFTTIDRDLAMLDKGKGLGGGCCDPYGPGPSLLNAMLIVMLQLGATPPSYLTAAAAQPFSWGSPFAGMGSRGSAGGMLLSAALTATRTAIAAYTAPA